MGLTVGDIIDRTLDEWLYPAGVNRPDFDILAGSIGASDSSFTVQGLLNTIPNSTIFEIGSEMILGQSVSGTTVTVNERGYLESTAASHLAGVKVYVNPDYFRIRIQNAVKSAIGLLFAWGAYRRVTDATYTFTSLAAQDAPVGAKEIKQIYGQVLVGNVQWRMLRPGVDYEVYYAFTPPKFQLRAGGIWGAPIQFVYSADYDLSTFTEATDLDTLGVSSTLQPYLPMAVAGYLLQGREAPRIQIEEIKRMLSAVGAQVQVGAALSVGSALIKNFRETYVEAEKTRLRKLDPVTVEYV